MLAVMKAFAGRLLANPTVIAIVAGITAVLGYGWKQRREGAAAERMRQAEAELKARDVSNQIDQDVGAMPPDKRREELKKWSR